jgi:Rps23 Pro-64 3,4-dihydroxylase Tpa1-like proline 4-hydroxylase
MQNQGVVTVTLLLNGGHNHTLHLKPGDPLLTALLSTMSEKTHGADRAARLFNIRIDDGKRSLIVASTDVIGLITDPALVHEGEKRQPAALAPLQTLGEGSIAKSPYVLLENFIEPERHAELLRFVAAREKEFVGSTVSTKDEDYRRSLVLPEFPQFAELFRDRVRSLMPRLASAFGLGEFPIGDIECQLTAHNDGHYYRLHNDSGSQDTLERAITYVFYFHNEPKGYSGGEFRLYNSRVANGRYECGEKAVDLEPKNNSILFFPSFCHHEVLAVHCPSKSFASSRFTINGWVRRATSAQRAA